MSFTFCSVPIGPQARKRLARLGLLRQHAHAASAQILDQPGMMTVPAAFRITFFACPAMPGDAPSFICVVRALVARVYPIVRASGRPGAITNG
jgi:hypothetical protein